MAFFDNFRKLTVEKKVRRLTLTGWLLVICACVALFLVWRATIHQFLAVNKPVDTNIWIVEGYIPDNILDSVAAVWRTNPSLLIVCAGLPVTKGEFCIGFDNAADYNTAYLREIGVDSLQVISALAQPVAKDRTYTMALATKEKLKALGYSSGKINIICQGTHARRSWLLYRKAYQPEWKVGVITYPDDEYPKQWWRTSEGARAVVFEMIGYIYCVFFFHP